MKHLIPFLIFFAGCQKSESRVVVYCAQDREYAESIFAEFDKTSSLKVVPKFDSEANKSVSLVVELEAEASRPRCDVHWNNEILGTIRLARNGLYEPYASSAAADFPDWTRPASKSWQSFAGRARVLIVNTNLVKPSEYPKSLLDLTDAKWKGKIAMAKPQFGTTATQAACLFEVLGAEKAKGFYRGLSYNKVNLVAGNKTVATGVSSGQFAIGLTDTDDAIIELKAGKPVAILFPDREKNAEHPRLGVLYIPNTLAVVKGSPNSAGAKKLIDYLLTQESELAEGGGYQIPLNPKVSAKLPPELLTPSQVHVMAVDFEKAADLREEVQAFLRDEFAR